MAEEINMQGPNLIQGGPDAMGDMTPEMMGAMPPPLWAAWVQIIWPTCPLRRWVAWTPL